MGAPLPAPDWDAFAPPAPGALGRVFGGASRYTRQVAEAQAKHDAAMAQHAADESARQRALAAAKAEYDRSVIAERTRVAQLNAQVAERQKGFAAGVPEAVEWFVSRVLERSRYPQGFPHAFQVAYRPENRDVSWSSNCLRKRSCLRSGDTSMSRPGTPLTRSRGRKPR